MKSFTYNLLTDNQYQDKMQILKSFIPIYCGLLIKIYYMLYLKTKKWHSNHFLFMCHYKRCY
jgi:hypothetical protein